MNDIDPREARLRSSYYTPKQLMALGRIAELSAQLEVLLRQVLAQVMGIGQDAADALFLGDRAQVLVARINALAEFSDIPKWFSGDAVRWAAKVDAAVRQRNQFLHRAPVVLGSEDDDEERVIGWNRARHNHKAEPLNNDRLLDLVERLSHLEEEAMGNLFWSRWGTSVGDARHGSSSDEGGEPDEIVQGAESD
jgi:hypothetical protein